jgi:hypothetical protein
MRKLLVTLLLLCAAPAWAGPGEIAAALPNEKSECRYLLDLCRRAVEADPLDALQGMIEVTKAAQVIRAKHEKMPGCFRKCVGKDGRTMLNLDRFK